MLIFVSSEVTIVVGSVALVGILVLVLLVLAFFLAAVAVFVKHCGYSKRGQIKARSAGFSSLLMMLKSS